ncbi:MAG: hypothetical protein E6840_21310, partial [Klebsiella pneumoniae]|nr:hypothetical protein [Klebsiella pneumoniae]MDU1778016.1 hypothetical protein [Klebsiella pneumoniae]
MAGKDMSAQRMTMIRFGLGLGLLIYFLFNVYLEDTKEGANKQVISSQADSLIKISRIWADFFPANTS